MRESSDGRGGARLGTEAEIDATLSEFKGNPRDAIEALLHDLKVLAEDSNMKVSKG